MSRYKQPYSLYKRGKYWYYRTYTTDGIRTVAKSTGCTSKNEARLFCDNLYLSGNINQNDVTFEKYASHFFDDESSYLRDRIKPLAYNTILQRRSSLNKILLPYFSKMKIRDINYSVLKTFRITLLDNDYSTYSIKQIMDSLKIIIDTAYKDRLIIINPFSLLERLPLKSKKNIDAFTLDEVKILWEEMPQEYKNPILSMALTGMRISEALGIIADEDIILHPKGFYYINLTRQLCNGRYSILKGKDEGYARFIPITEELKDIFNFRITNRKEFYQWLKKIKEEKLDVKDRYLIFHSLRHFFITNAKACNINPSKVEYLAGHSLKDSATANIYTNFKAEDLTDILQWQRDIFFKITMPEHPTE